MNRRVAITGIGIYSCIGQNIADVTKSLYNGTSGIGIMPERLNYGYKSPLTGILPSPNLKGKLDRRLRIGLAQQGEYAYLAAAEAFENAKIYPDYIEKNDIGIIFGNDSSTKPIIESNKIMEEKHDTAMVGSASVFQSMNSTVTMNLATIFKLRGVNFTVSAACASSTHALGLGLMMIRSGMQNIVLCGGAQEVNLYSVMSFDALGVFSNRTECPQKASRPFDAARDGLVPSGGAAAIILEDMQHALKRGAKIYGELVGYGFSSNGEKITKPGADGTTIAMQNALKDANIAANQINYINAHATSTPLGDAAEAAAITNVFGKNTPWISSTKSMTGHECWMAGASEIVYSIIMMENGFIAPNINFETPDQYTAKLKIATQKVETNIDTILSNSFGFGGTNAVLIIKKYNE